MMETENRVDEISVGPDTFFDPSLVAAKSDYESEAQETDLYQWMMGKKRPPTRASSRHTSGRRSVSSAPMESSSRTG